MVRLVQSEKNDDQVGREVLIHVRHLPGGAVMSIDRCPSQLTAQQWRDLLLTEASEYYQAFIGARGFFRIPQKAYDALLAKLTPMAAE